MEEYQSFFMESFNQSLKDSLKALATLLKRNGIHFTFIGGAARNKYASARMTEDVDILVSKKDKNKMLHLPIGEIKELSHGTGRRFKMYDPLTDIDVIYEGDVSGGSGGLIYPDPQSISTNEEIPFIDLKDFVLYKISSGLYGKGRYMDFADVIAVIQKNNLKKDFMKGQRKDIIDQYNKLWEEAQ